MLDKKYFEIDDQLKMADLLWLTELEDKWPEFLDSHYSNPYFATIPKGWLESSVRILIVGEEGNGEWGGGKDSHEPNEIDFLHQFNWEYLATNLYPDDVQRYELFPDAEHESLNRSAFWNRARKVSQYGNCAWTNQDRIHLRKKRDCSLTEEDRSKLHSLECRLLQQEISILNPTHVFFFGFYRKSISHELPEVFRLLQPDGYEDKSRWFKSVINIPYRGRNYIFSYHPGWKGKPAGYEGQVLETLAGSIRHNQSHIEND